MKKTVILLIGLSVALNFALLGLFVVGGDSAPAPAPVPVAAAPAVPKAAAPALDGSIWPGLKSDALPELVRNLREAGFPPELVRAIATARVEESFAARINAVFGSAYQANTFWKVKMSDPALMSAAMKLDRERQLALREALGSDAPPGDALEQAMRGRRLDMLPPEKAAELHRIFREFDDKIADLRSTGTGSIDRDKMAALDKAQREAIARVLTPPELEEFDLRNSTTSRLLRTDLSVFAPTEAEFRTLFRLRQPFDDRFNLNYGYLGLNPEQRLQQNEAQKILNEQIKAALGPARYAEYERATDYSYRSTAQLVTRLQLAPDTTNQVWAVQKDIQPRAMALIRDQSLAPEVRNQQLAALQTEATGKLTPLLGGASGMDAYKQYGGQWLQTLQPRPAPGMPPPRQ